MKSLLLFLIFIFISSQYDDMNKKYHLFDFTSSLQDSTLFRDVHEEAGIFHYSNHRKMLGGGVAFFDYNNDGFEDIYLTGGLDPDKLMKNNGDGTFKDVSMEAGILVSNIFYTTGVVAGDLDNDGDKDLLVTTDGTEGGIESKNILLQNLGNGKFLDSWILNNIEDNVSAIGAILLDYNLDGLLDIYTINYVKKSSFITDENENIIGYDHDCYSNRLYKNVGNLYEWEDVTVEVGLFESGCSLAALATDFDLDGDSDIMLINDFGVFVEPNRLYQNNGGTFIDISDSLNFNQQIYGMGITGGDYDNDLDFDYYMSNLGRNVFLKNDSSGFTDIADELNVDDTWNIQDTFLSVSWGTNFLDADNDGDLDLTVANGFIPGVDFIPTQVFNNDRFFLNDSNGGFEELPYDKSGIINSLVSRGTAYSDYDNDGDLDFFTPVIAFPLDIGIWRSKLYQNQTNDKGNFLKISLRGLEANKDAIGSIIYAYADENHYLREVRAGGSHCSSNSSIVHFGLGNHQKVDSLVIHWPSLSHPQRLFDIEVNQLLTIVEDTIKVDPDNNGLDTMKIDTMQIDTMNLDTTLIDFKTLENQVFVYPNPTNGVLFFENISEGKLIDIFDLNGRFISKASISNKHIDISFLQRGIFLLKFEGSFQIKKIILL